MDNIRSIVQEELQKYATQNQYGVSKIPVHNHDGLSSTRIAQKDIVQNTKLSAFLTTTLTTGGTEVDTIVNVPNLTSLSFMGFAANNAVGSATKRAIINGRAEIGTCSLFADSVTRFVPAKPISILQMSNSMYVDSTDLTKNRVSATSGNVDSSGVYTGIFCYAADDTGTVLVQTVVSYDNATVTFTTDIASGWKLQGDIILS